MAALQGALHPRRGDGLSAGRLAPGGIPRRPGDGLPVPIRVSLRYGFTARLAHGVTIDAGFHGVKVFWHGVQMDW
jgi:hypothetical protein